MRKILMIVGLLAVQGAKAEDLQIPYQIFGPEKAYCQAVQNMDPNVNQKSSDNGAWSWRCVYGKLLVCPTGADGVGCSMRAANPKPFPSMIEACKTDGYLSVATGAYNSRWKWECKNGKPVNEGLAYKVDGYGFVYDEWREVK